MGFRELKSKEAIRSLVEIVEVGSDFSLRISSLTSLVKIDDENAVGILTQMLTNMNIFINIKISGAIIESLGYLRDPTALESIELCLLKMYSVSEEEEDIQYIHNLSIKALRRIGTDKAKDAIKQWTETRDERMWG